jgi:HSP20 family protein
MLPAPFLSLGRELNQAENRLRKLFGPEFEFGMPMAEPVGWVPNVEIVEHDAELLLTAELPGLVKEDVDITFENDVLTIRGEKKKEETKEEKVDGVKWHVWERGYGEFIRSFTLPKTIETAKISAEMKDGVLKVRLPKTASPAIKGQKIEIQAK